MQTRGLRAGTQRWGLQVEVEVLQLQEEQSVSPGRPKLMLLVPVAQAHDYQHEPEDARRPSCVCRDEKKRE